MTKKKGPPKVPSQAQPEQAYVDPDDYLTRSDGALTVRQTIVNLRQVIGTDGWLESVLMDSLRYIGYSKLNAQAITDEIAGYSISVKHMRCKHATLAACLYYSVLLLLSSWHQWCAIIDEDAIGHADDAYQFFMEQLAKVQQVVECGLYNAMIIGDECKGYAFTYEV